MLIPSSYIDKAEDFYPAFPCYNGEVVVVLIKKDNAQTEEEIRAAIHGKPCTFVCDDVAIPEWAFDALVARFLRQEGVCL